MDKDLRKMKKMVDFMRKQGVLTLKTPEMELRISSAAIFPENKLIPEEEKTNSEHQFTEEEIILWSSPGSIPEGQVQ